MNKTKIILITLVIIILASFVLYGVRSTIQKQEEVRIEQIVVGEPITSTTTNYVSETGDEAIVVYHSNNTISLTLLNTEYRDVILESSMVPSIEQYENKELELVLMGKPPEINIYKNNQAIFSGKDTSVVGLEHTKKYLIGPKWMWTKTLLDVGPLAQDADSVVPKKPDVFSLTFMPDGKVQGTTDCNGFGGAYTLDGGGSRITFDSFMATLMYCDGSQEEEFRNMIQDAIVYVKEEELILEANGKTIYFKKGE